MLVEVDEADTEVKVKVREREEVMPPEEVALEATAVEEVRSAEEQRRDLL